MRNKWHTIYSFGKSAQRATPKPKQVGFEPVLKWIVSEKQLAEYIRQQQEIETAKADQTAKKKRNKRRKPKDKIKSKPSLSKLHPQHFMIAGSNLRSGSSIISPLLPDTIKIYAC